MIFCDSEEFKAGSSCNSSGPALRMLAKRGTAERNQAPHIFQIRRQFGLSQKPVLVFKMNWLIVSIWSFSNLFLPKLPPKHIMNISILAKEKSINYPPLFLLAPHICQLHHRSRRFFFPSEDNGSCFNFFFLCNDCDVWRTDTWVMRKSSECFRKADWWKTRRWKVNVALRFPSSRGSVVTFFFF